MPFPDSPTTTGWLLTCDFLFGGVLVQGGSIFDDRALAVALYEAGAPVINFDPDPTPGAPPDPLLALIKGYQSQRVRDPSVQFMPYVAPLIKDGFDNFAFIIQTRLGFFNGVGSFNSQMQWGANQSFEDPNPQTYLLPTVQQDQYGNWPLGGVVQLVRTSQTAASVVLQDAGGRPIGFDLGSAGASFNVSWLNVVELMLIVDTTQPWPAQFWQVTNVRNFPT